MNDVVLFLIVYIIGYLVVLSVVIGLIKFYFPFFSEDELKMKNLPLSE
jgi:hypothetical protein